jgi:hypothetical protein
LFLSFDETDDLAHAGQYAEHLQMVQSIDRYLGDLWQMLQSMPQYAGKTAMLITTDHGRGHTPKARWKDHGTKTADSYQIWLAAMGPGVATASASTPGASTPGASTPGESTPGEQKNGPVLYQNQIAATLAKLLGLTFTADHPVGAPIDMSPSR